MKTKICNVVVSADKINNHLYKEGAINEYTKITDVLAFKNTADKINMHVKDNYSTQSDMVFQENGMARVNSQVLSSVWNQLFPKSPSNKARISYENGTNRALAYRAIDKIRTLIPNTTIKTLNTDEVKKEFGDRYSNSKGFKLGDNTIVINTDLFDVDTPFHEYGHIVLKYLKETQPEVYSTLMQKSLLHHTAAQIAAVNPKLTGEDLGEEIFVTQIGLNAAVHFAKSNKVLSTVKGFFKKYMYKLFNVKIGAFSLDDSIDSIMDRYSKDILDGDSFLFQTLSPNQIDNIINRARTLSDKDIKRQLLSQGFIKKVNGIEVFFDIRREKSEVYYNIAEKGDTKKAEAEYIAYMAKFIDIRHSRVNTQVLPKDAIKRIDEIHKNLKLKTDNYLDIDSGETTNRASNFLRLGINDKGGYYDEIETRRMAEFSTKSFFRRKFILEHKNEEARKDILRKQADPSFKKKNRETKEREAADFAGAELTRIETTSVFTSKIQEYLDLFELKTELGSEMHALADDFILLRQQLMLAKRDDVSYRYTSKGKKEQIIRSPKYPKSVELKIYEKGTSKYSYAASMDALIGAYATHPVNGKSPTAKQITSRAEYYKQLNIQLNKFEATKKGFMTYRTEMRTGHTLMGYSGTADLVAIEAGTNKLTVMDHKTKERPYDNPKKYREAWNSTLNANFTGAFSQYTNNPHNKASIQTSLYRLMYELQGFDVEDSALVFYTDGELLHGTTSEYQKVQVETIQLHDMRQLLIEEFTRHGVDLKTLTQEKNNDIHETIADIFNNEDGDVFEPSQEMITRVFNSSKMLVDNFGNEFYGFTFGNSSNKFAYPAALAFHATDSSNGRDARKAKKKKDTIAAQKKYIISQINNKKRLLAEEDEIVSYFNNPTTVTKPHRQAYLNHRLRGLNKDTHTLSRISAKGGFGSNYAGILLFKNNLTDEHTVMILNSYEDVPISIGDDSKYLTGTLTADINARRDLVKMRATRHNVKILKTMAVLAKLKKNDPTFAVEYVYKAPIIGDIDGATIPINFQDAMQDATYLFELAGKKGKLKNTAHELLAKNRYMRPDTFSPNMLVQMQKFFESRAYLTGIFNTAADLVDEAIGDKYADMGALAVALVNIRRDGVSSLTSEERRTLEKAISYTQNVHHTALNQDIHTVEKMLITPQNYKSSILQEMQSTMRANKARALREFTPVIRENAKFTKKFLGVQNPGRVLTNEKFKNLFLPLNVNNPENFYRLKPEGSMSKAELEYVTMWKKHMKAALLMNVKQNKDTIKKINKFIDEGYVPLIYPGFAKIVAASTNTWETLTKAAVQKTSIGESNEKRWELKPSYSFEFSRENDDIQFTDSRKRKLKINDQNVASEIPNFEMDLEVILNRVSSEASMVKYGRVTLAVGEGLTREASYQTIKLDASNNNIVEVIDTLVRIGVKGFQAEGAPEKIASKTGSLSSYTAIALSPSSIVMEGVTNAANIAKLWVQESLMNRFFGVKQRFNTRHLLKAAKLITTEPKKAKALMLAFGIAEPDPAQLRRFIEISEKNKMFKSDNLFGLQSLFLSLAQTEIVIAAMLKDGSWDAYKVDDFGNMEYDIKKDLRLYDSSLRGDEKDKQLALRERIGVDLSKEGKRIGDNKFSMGYTDLELQALKDYAVEAFSSMDDDSKNPSTYAFFGKLQGKYRTWILPRVARLMGTSAKGRMSNFNWVYIRDDAGKVVDVIPQFGIAEGYLYTVGRMLNAASQHMFTGKDINKMTQFEKAQLSKLIADSTIVFGIYALLAVTKCSDKEIKHGSCWYSSYAGKLIKKALIAAPGDVFIFIALAQAAFGSNSSMMPGLTSLWTSVQNLIYAGILGATGEEGAAEKLANVTAVSKHLYNWVNEEKTKRMKE